MSQWIICSLSLTKTLEKARKHFSLLPNEFQERSRTFKFWFVKIPSAIAAPPDPVILFQWRYSSSSCWFSIRTSFNLYAKFNRELNTGNAGQIVIRKVELFNCWVFWERAKKNATRNVSQFIPLQIQILHHALPAQQRLCNELTP